MRIALAGGGTGGHITPMLSCAQALRQLSPDIELIYIGENDVLTQQLVRGSGLPPRFIMAGKWRRYPADSWGRQVFDLKTHLLNLRDLTKIFVGFWQSVWVLIRWRPQVVFVKGGYVGLPVGMAAWLLNIPLVIHESDSVPGLTNRLLAPLARTIATGWPTKHYPGWSNRRVVFTGNPIRTEILAKPAAGSLGVKPSRSTLLILGGSRGAHVINQAVVKHLADLTRYFQIIHISGKADYPGLKQLTSPSQGRASRYHLYPWLDVSELAAAYRAATIILSRGGMNSLAEIAAIRKPLVVVPHPNTPGDHQARNAHALEQDQAAVVIEQANLDEQLVPTLKELLRAPEHQRLLVKGLGRLAKPEAADLLAKQILRVR